MLAAVGEQSDKPLVSTFLASEGVPELLRVPDVAGSTAGRGSVPSYSAVEAAVRALARVVEYAAWLEQARGCPASPPRRSTWPERAAAAQRDPDRLARGAGPRPSRSSASCSAPTAWTCGSASRWPPRRRRWRRGSGSAGTSCSRRPPSTCASAPTWRTCGATSTPRRRCATPGRRMHEIIDEPDRAGFIVQRVAAPGVPVSDRRDGGPAVRPGGVLRRSPARPPSCSATAPTGSRRCTAGTLPRWCARSRPRRCSSGYRGAELVDVEAVEHLLLRVAQLKNDLPQVARPRPEPGARRRATAPPCSTPVAGSSRSPTPAPTGSSAGSARRRGTRCTDSGRDVVRAP